MNTHTICRRMTLLCLLALPMLTGPARQAPLRHASPGAETLSAPPAQSHAATQTRISDAYGRLPLSFEANQGQTDSRVQFLSRGRGYSLYLTSTEAVLRLGKADYGSPDKGQSKESLDILPQTPFSALQLPHSARRIPHSAFRTPHSKTHTPPSAVLRMKLVGANPTAQVTGLEDLPGKTNYFLGNDPKRWRTNIATYNKVKYNDVYPGIDLVYYGRQQQLEYDFVLAPGADPKNIQMRFEGVDKLEVDAEGNLVLHTAVGELVQHPPSIYQDSNGTKQTISARYVLLATESPQLSTGHAPGTAHQVGFEVGTYNRRRALVIDPILIYSTYLGGSSSDSGRGIAVDSAGNAYVTGSTSSPDFPTQNPLQPPFAGGDFFGDAFVTKLNAAGTALLYSTYLGGSGNDRASSIAVDTAGNAYVTGSTDSPDFPTRNPLQPALGGDCGSSGCPDAFVVKLNAAGSALLYSTYLGGSGDDRGAGSGDDGASSIAVDTVGNAYVTGFTQSSDFPTQNPLQPAHGGDNCGDEPGPCPDAFVAKLNVAGTALLYSTYLGGPGPDNGNGIAVDLDGNAYVTGGTGSNDFPTANPLQSTCPSGFNSNAFVAKLNVAGSALVYSTCLGGSEFPSDVGNDIAVDSAGNAYVTGQTSSPDFPTQNPLQSTCMNCASGVPNGFVAKLNATGSALVYSTYLGGSGDDGASSIAVDTAGNAYLTGRTSSPDFPTANPLQPAFGGGFFGDAFVAKLNAAGSALVYSTYLGGNSDDFGFGIAVDSAGNAHVTGDTASPDFPTANPLQPANGGNSDAFVAKIATGPVTLQVAVDIKPGGSPNSINPRSNGNIPVAVLTTDSFDASSVDPSTVRFGRTGQEAAPLRSSLEDVDGDGDLELVLHFDTQQTGLQCGDTSARLTGKTFDGLQLEGSDSVRTVGCQ